MWLKNQRFRPLSRHVRWSSKTSAEDLKLLPEILRIPGTLRFSLEVSDLRRKIEIFN
jgi:hypothetical protein